MLDYFQGEIRKGHVTSAWFSREAPSGERHLSGKKLNYLETTMFMGHMWMLWAASTAKHTREPSGCCTGLESQLSATTWEIQVRTVTDHFLNSWSVSHEPTQKPVLSY